MHSISIDPVARRGHVDLHGHVTGHSMGDACKALRSHPDWQADYDEVWDFSPAQSVVIGTEDWDALLALTRAYRHVFAPNRVAVVSRDESVRLIVGLYERQFRDLGRRFEYVPTTTRAGEWLRAAA